jgi:hypothetical protein
LENINSGLKLLGNKNDRRLEDNKLKPTKQSQSGVSNNIADLVSQSFAPASNKQKQNQRQDNVVVGENGPPALSDNTMMSGLLKLLGFDGAKIGAVALNGIVFIAQMVRNGAVKFMDIFMRKTWDWYMIVNYVMSRVKTEPEIIESTTLLPPKSRYYWLQ